MKRIALLPAIGLLLALAGCSSSSSSTSPAAPFRLYSASDSNTDVSYYTSPFSASTTPTGSITGFSAPFGVAIDPTNSSNVFVADDVAGTIAAYTRPNPASALAFTVVSGINPGEINFDAAGNLYYTNFTTSSVSKVAHPVVNGSPLIPLVTSGLNAPQCSAADALGNLYVLDGSSTPHRVLMFAPPYTGAPIVTTSNMSTNTDACAINPATNQFFVGNNAGSILGFTTPLTANEVPGVILNSSFSAGNGAQQYGIAFDRFGNMYIASQNFVSNTLTSATISLYLGPSITSGQSASISFPDVSISTPGTIKLTKQMAVGQ